MDCTKCVQGLAIFVGGVLFGSAGFKLLASKDAKKVYARTAAAGIRAKDSVMETVTSLREGLDDILEDAKEINRQRETQQEVVEDTSAGA